MVFKVLYQNQGPPVFDPHNLFKLTFESLQNLQNQGTTFTSSLAFSPLQPLSSSTVLLTLYPLAFLPFVGFNLVQIEDKKLERSNAMGF